MPLDAVWSALAQFQFTSRMPQQIATKQPCYSSCRSGQRPALAPAETLLRVQCCGTPGATAHNQCTNLHSFPRWVLASVQSR